MNSKDIQSILTVVLTVMSFFKSDVPDGFFVTTAIVLTGFHFWQNKKEAEKTKELKDILSAIEKRKMKYDSKTKTIIDISSGFENTTQIAIYGHHNDSMKIIDPKVTFNNTANRVDKDLPEMTKSKSPGVDSKYQSSNQREFSKRDFKNETVNLDNGAYKNCSFTNCEIIYGGGFHELNSCSFDYVRWDFAGYAANTLKFMQALYNMEGNGGKKIVDDTFDAIKANKLI